MLLYEIKRRKESDDHCVETVTISNTTLYGHFVALIMDVTYMWTCPGDNY